LRLHRLQVSNFASISDADIEFGPGLNVLYGPNDLGKSTLAEAIRLALLLPHTSTHIEEYLPWTGGRDPVIEITFETGSQRIWRVRKEFRKGGTALLQESKNGVDFDDVERARKVDGRLRDILRWGIPEPGGAGGGKGLPTSFLATVLLSTQSDVTDVLEASLQGDPSGTGRELIAAALQAVAQDPLFTAMLRATQARRDEAFTDKGSKKTAKGSVFQVAAVRVNQARVEREEFQRLVDNSEGVEQQLRGLTVRRGQLEEAVAVETARLEIVEQLAAQAAALHDAEEQVRLASEEVLRIQKISSDVEAAEQTVGDLARKLEAADEALKVAHLQKEEAAASLESAEKTARSAGSDSTMTDTVARQRLELQKVAADQASREAQQRIDDATSAQKLIDAVASANRDHLAQQTEAEKAQAELADAVANERSTQAQLRTIDLLERALDARDADNRVSTEQADVDKLANLQTRLAMEVGERAALEKLRAAIIVPAADTLGSMRRLGTDLAGARGALNVGLVVTVKPSRPIDIRANKDGTAVRPAVPGETLEVEANAEIDIDIGDIANVRIRGGRRDAQQDAEAMEVRWRSEVEPHLRAANVQDLDGLSGKIAEAQALDANVTAKDVELQSLQAQIDSLGGSMQKLEEALNRQKACNAALGHVSLETLLPDLATLGAEPSHTLRERRQHVAKDIEQALAKVHQAGIAHTLAEERTKNSASALKAAVVARDVALVTFSEGVAAALSDAQTKLAGALDEQQKVAAELASLESTIAAQNERVEAAIRETRAIAEQAQAGLDGASAVRTNAITAHALQVGRLEELRRSREAEDLATAESNLKSASDRQAALPVPERIVTEADLTVARDAKTTAESELSATQREIERTHGALEQVGGAVARERLRDAVDAFELAERQEQEIEAEYDAWSLLLDQMKQADAAQASNLGQTLAPAIAGRFEALTQRRYESVRLTAQLGTEGVVVAGAMRSTQRISVGTREQLSTLYRLALAEYLSTTVVLDDQLVQSDGTRMDWFRALLAEKARTFQIVVFTCRPDDYLKASAKTPKGKSVHIDTDGGFVRAVDLGRAVRRR
jgi:energy-coupling factor transporter ATP-binding protein EcfA2